MELVYRFRNRRQAADAVAALVDNDDVEDLGVFVTGRGATLIWVKTSFIATNNRVAEARIRGTLGLGRDCTKRVLREITALDAGLRSHGCLEAYVLKEGAKRFKGYSYRRTGE